MINKSLIDSSWNTLNHKRIHWNTPLLFYHRKKSSRNRNNMTNLSCKPKKIMTSFTMTASFLGVRFVVPCSAPPQCISQI